MKSVFGGKKILSILGGLVLTFAFATSVSAALQTDLVGWWKFDEASGTTAADSSASPEDGTNFGVILNGSYYEFDGLDDYVQVQHADKLDVTGAYSIEAWVYVNDDLVNKYRPIIFRGTTDANDIEIYVQANTKDLVVAHNRGNGGTFDFVRFADPPLDDWFNLAVVYDGTELHVFYDSVEPAITQNDVNVLPPQDTDKDWWIGKVDHTAFGTLLGGSDTNFFKRYLDDVRIWKVALIEEELGMTDVDDDDVLSGFDNCPDVANPGQENADEDSYGDACEPDTDSDGVIDDLDNCDLDANPDQKDFDDDDIGDVCDSDSDDDDVPNTEDFCPGTPETREYFSSPNGVHRWYWDGQAWKQEPNKQSKGNHEPIYIADTYGCNCHQILDVLIDAGLGEFGGHYKFGCSTSILEDFKTNLSDGDLDGKYLIEKFAVPADKSTDTFSVNPLVNGITYILKASGTANAGDGIEFDARYSFRTPSSTIWTDAVSTYEYLGNSLLDLLFNGVTPWGAFDSSHVYEATVTGTGVVVPFRIYDVYYPNNTGSLLVDIYAQL